MNTLVQYIFLPWKQHIKNHSTQIESLLYYIYLWAQDLKKVFFYFIL